MKQLLIIGAALAALALANAQDAHADEGSFIDNLGNDGVTITTSTLPLGHAICAQVSAEGVDGVQKVMVNFAEAGESVGDASYFLVEAVWELCPSNLPAMRAWAHHTAV